MCVLGGQIRATEDDPGAIEYYQQALKLAEAIDNPLRKGEYLRLLGRAHRDLGVDEQAAGYFCRMLVAPEGISSPLAAKMREEGAAAVR